MRKFLLDFVLMIIIAAMFYTLLVQVISPTATLMLSPLITLVAEILRKQAVIACNCKLRGVAIKPFWKTLNKHEEANRKERDFAHKTSQILLRRI